MNIILFLFLFLKVQAEAEIKDPFQGKNEMHGFKLKDFQDFEKKWKLVTVRFRKDTGELRFTYANPKAWKALQKGGTSYPKGSIFAKIGLATEEDPAFVSSAVPSGTRRYQFMVRDDKYKETDGWAYALFDSEGKTFPGEPNLASKACAACHRLVPDRGYVFSKPMTLSAFALPKLDKKDSERVGFIDIKANKLPEVIRKHIPAHFNNLREITGVLTDTIFQGTLDEVRPTLAKESLRRGLPSLLRDKAGQMFSLVYATGNNSSCAKGEVEMLGIHSLMNKDEVHTLRFCQKAEDK